MVMKWVLIISLVIIAYSNFEAKAENPPISLILSRQGDDEKTCEDGAGCDTSCTAGGWSSTTDMDVVDLGEMYCDSTKCKKESVTSPAGFKYTCDALVRTGDGCSEGVGCVEGCGGPYIVKGETFNEKQSQHRNKLCKDGMTCFPSGVKSQFVCKVLCKGGEFCNLAVGCDTRTNYPNQQFLEVFNITLEEAAKGFNIACLSGTCENKDGLAKCTGPGAQPSRAGRSLTPFVGILGVTLLLIFIQ